MVLGTMINVNGGFWVLIQKEKIHGLFVSPITGAKGVFNLQKIVDKEIVFTPTKQLSC